MKFWLSIILITVCVLAIGWSEPLRYRFMSRQEIYAEEHPMPEIASETPVPWMWDPNRRTPLDRPSYNEKRSVNYYPRSLFSTPIP